MAEKYSLALTLKILLLDFIYYIVTFISDIIDSVIVIVFWLRQEPSKCKCLFDESLSRALNLHLKAVWVCPRSVPGQSQVSPMSVSA